MKYIAYGSNMEMEPMAIRCPHAKLLGMGWLLNMTLEFYVHATVEPAADESRVPVAVWEIDEIDEQQLDEYEDYPVYYRKEEHEVQMNDGSMFSGMVYVMNEEWKRARKPWDDYYEGICMAYQRLGLREEIHTILLPALERCLQRLTM